MNNKIIAIASSKGGVGKSTIGNHLARTMAKAGEKTILIETDSGLRGLDILLNIPNVIYDIYDVVKNNCKIDDAIQTSLYDKNLSLLPAPINFQSKLNFSNLKQICNQIEPLFANIIIDLNGDFNFILKMAEMVDTLLIVTTPDPVCVRDVAIFVNYLKNETEKNLKMLLIINKVQKRLIAKGIIKNIDEIIDEIAIQLVGVIPQNNKMEIANFSGESLKRNSLPQKIFDAIFQRINNNNKKLLI